MNRVIVAAVIASLSAASCAEDPAMQELPEELPDTEKESAEIGDLTLQLTGSDSQGRIYRLRSAEFLVTNYSYPYVYDEARPAPYPPTGYDAGPSYPSQVISTETNPDADSISLRLVPGTYLVTLQGNWFIERWTARGAERVEKVVLLSEPQQYAYVYQNGVSPVIFRFGVDGDLIDFRHGDLVIDTEFELPGESDFPVYDGGPYPRYDGGPYPIYDAGAAYDAGPVVSEDAGPVEIPTDAGVGRPRPF